MNLAFTKMHGLGNDFMVIDLVTQEADLNAEARGALGRSPNRDRF